MSFQLLLGLAALAAFVALAVLRILRVRSHRDPAEGWQRLGIAVAFLLVPPFVLQVLFATKAGPGAVDMAGAIVLYVLAFLVLFVLAWIVALLIARFAPIEWRQTLLLALIGRDTSGVVAFDPPMTGELAADVERVDSLNSVFPRGPAFIGQALLPGFQSTWAALDAATLQLETRIAEQRRLGLGVAQRAIETASDARGRLDTLKRDAAIGGQAWAA